MPTSALPDALARLRDEAARELTGHILPYWADRTVDHEYGGFIGQINGDNAVCPRAPKGAVLHTRLLWTFAEAARVLDAPAYRSLADRAYGYLSDRFWDPEHGGVFWMLDYRGRALEPVKRVYAQAYAIYALAAYHRLTGDPAPLKRAIALFELVERRTTDPAHGGYFEAFDPAWRRLPDVRLSPKDPPADKSTNTHLHVLEAYATLYRAWPSEPLRDRLAALIRRFLHTIVHPHTHHMDQAFDERWQPVSRVISFGHDIEASWLLTEAADVVGEAPLRADAQAEAVRMAEAALRDGMDTDGGLLNEARPDGLLDDDKHWWPQAEAVVGFLNAFQITHDERFLDAALRSWAFIQRAIVDREHGEWFYRVTRAGRPYPSENKVGPWKGPYHNVRACLEVMARADRMAAPPNDG